MISSPWLRWFFSVAAIFLSIPLSAQPVSPPYKLKDLGNVSVFALNDIGQVVGSMEGTPTGQYLYLSKAMLWNPDGSSTELARYEGNDYGTAYANGINNLGEVIGSVGCRLSRCSPSAFYWSYTLGRHNVSQNATLNAINDGGKMAGSVGSFPPQPAKWNSPSSGPQILDSVEHPFEDNAGSASSINHQGAVVGNAYWDNSRALVWAPNGAKTEIRAMAPGSNGSEYIWTEDINDQNAVVGKTSTTTGSHAFIWTAVNGIKDLGTLAGHVESNAFGINNQGIAVGLSSLLGSDGSRAVLWTQDGNITDLNSFVDLAGVGFTSLNYAVDINNVGQIIGYGETVNGENHAFILSPVPETEVWVFMFIGLGLMIWKLREQKIQASSPFAMA